MHIKSSNIYQQLLEYGVLAPSGDNSQPWSFRIKENGCYVFAVPHKDNPAYNFASRGTLIAIGCLLQNIKITAAHFGYDISIDYFPDAEDKNCIAFFSIIKQKLSSHPLFSSISLRATNRRPYAGGPVSGLELSQIISAAENNFGIEVKFISEKVKIRKVAEVVNLNERIVLENKPLHSYFFQHIRWTEREEKDKKTGLYLPTLELGWLQKTVFRLLRIWRVMQFFNTLGVGRQVAAENANVYAQSALVGAISIKRHESIDYVRVGEVLEHIWLTVTHLGLQMQLTTGIMFFMHRIRSGHVDNFFSEKNIPMISAAYAQIKDVFNCSSDEEVVIVFRVGRSDGPSGRSSRIPPVINEL